MAVRPALPRRAGRRTNLALLGLLLLAFITGVLAFGVGKPTAATAVVAIHGAAGLGLLLLVPWKAVIVRRSWPHAPSTRALATGLGVLVALTVQDAGQDGERDEGAEPGRQPPGARGVRP